MKTVAITLALSGLTVALLSGPANACSYELGPENLGPRYPWYSTSGFPTNGVFTEDLGWRSDDGPLVLVPDPDLSALWGRPVQRPLGGTLPPGSVFVSGDSGSRLEVAEGPDVTPPERAVLATVTTQLVRDPSGGGGFSCPDVDSLVLHVTGSDDTTPDKFLALLAMIGADEAEVASRQEPDLVFGYDEASRRDQVSNIYLGVAAGRERDGEPFRSPSRFCFAVALMDWAGNVGERSDVRCLDTTDPDDPTVEWVDGAGCSCSLTGASAGTGRGTGAFLGLALFLWWRRHAQRVTQAASKIG